MFKSFKYFSKIPLGSGRSNMTKTFHLCKPLKSEHDAFHFRDWLSETWVNLAMGNVLVACCIFVIGCLLTTLLITNYLVIANTCARCILGMCTISPIL